MDNASLKGYFKPNIRSSLIVDLRILEAVPLDAGNGLSGEKGYCSEYRPVMKPVLIGN